MTKQTASTENERPQGLDRRGFLAGATALGLTLLKPQLASGTQANSKVALGLVGCGGRGNWIADLFAQHGGYEFVGVADYFPDRAEKSGDRLKVPVGRRYSGLAGYKRLLDSKLDAIVIQSPPYFHPEQALAGVDAGCHVYCAKPISVDVPGCLTIGEAGKRGTEKKRCVLVDFQTRANEFYQEAIRRVHAGDIGPVLSAEAVYYCGPTWSFQTERVDLETPEGRLRAWGRDRILSGDIITEQNIHALDVAAWVIDKDPVCACGACGRKGRSDPGTCNDYFAVTYTFPDDVALAFASKQFGSGYDDIGCRAFGPKGSLETHYFGGPVMIRGEKSYKGGRIRNLYTEGAVKNIADFHANIHKGDFSNPTVAPSVRSNLTTILGRLAAYRKNEVTWDEMMKANEKLEFPLASLKS